MTLASSRRTDRLPRTSRANTLFFPVAQKADDQPTADLLRQRRDIHEKTAWMPRALLED